MAGESETNGPYGVIRMKCQAQNRGSLSWDWSCPYAVSMLGTHLRRMTCLWQAEGSDQRIEEEIVSLLLPLLDLGICDIGYKRRYEHCCQHWQLSTPRGENRRSLKLRHFQVIGDLGWETICLWIPCKEAGEM